MRKLLATAALATVLAFPMTAGAATTVSIGDSIVEEQILTPGGVVVFDFLADSNLQLINIGLTGQGVNNGDDLENVTFVVTRASDAPSAAAGFDPNTIQVFGGTLSIAGEDLPDVTLFEGDTLNILFNDGIQNNVDIRVAFNAVAPVPLPAAGGMLLSGLLAAGFIARRKKKKAA